MTIPLVTSPNHGNVIVMVQDLLIYAEAVTFMVGAKRKKSNGKTTENYSLYQSKYMNSLKPCERRKFM